MSRRNLLSDTTKRYDGHPYLVAASTVADIAADTVAKLNTNRRKSSILAAATSVAASAADTVAKLDNKNSSLLAAVTAVAETASASADFEAKHPRAKGGEFTDKGKGEGSTKNNKKEEEKINELSEKLNDLGLSEYADYVKKMLKDYSYDAPNIIKEAEIYIEKAIRTFARAEEAKKIQAQKDELREKDPNKVPRNPSEAGLPSIDDFFDMKKESKKHIAPENLQDVIPTDISKIERLPLTTMESDMAKWKYRITDDIGRSATISGNASIDHSLANDKPYKLVREMMNKEKEERTSVSYNPDMNENGIRNREIKKHAKKAYTLYKSMLNAKTDEAFDKVIVRMQDKKIPIEAIDYIKNKYVKIGGNQYYGEHKTVLEPFVDESPAARP